MNNSRNILGMNLATALLGAGMAFTSSTAILGLGSGTALAQGMEARAVTAGMPPVNDGLPLPGFEITPETTAIVITDPQNDFLSPDGVTWGVVGQSITANGTVENLAALFDVADKVGMPVFVSPHFYFEHDHEWHFEGTLETLMHSIGMFDRPHALSLDGFEGAGADWLELYKPFIDGDNVIVTSPHKIYGPDSNDLALQLRKAGIDKVILGGMSSNLCTESHMRSLIEAGFEVMVVTDATAGAITPLYDGYAASLTNFRMIASDVNNTENTLRAIETAYGK
ncbi:cysteine hydrolase family protein [Aliiruegeria lutimaris]|uniref:Nicotinamidase-related amidase n=1 Tax=Aliiruegeria lutimaris TaxID=571298 RepID=A0A1G8MR66_9RHOB|nr:isochorismatase family protein [Aliiruegeria lutimaris]SDI70422.1 Nicotinamidase-related amidase [Aliiruegeria lutimaris]